MCKEFWPLGAKEFSEKLGIENPIIQAPMAGGPSTPELVAAVSNAGGLGSLGAGYLAPEQIDTEIRKVRDLTDKPFSVNLFVLDDETSPVISEKVLKQLEKYSRQLGVELPGVSLEPAFTFDDQLAVIVDNSVPVFSFTFGVPGQGSINKLLDRGVMIIGTATCSEEGVLLQEAGCSAVVAQGIEAGGHRGTFWSTADNPMIGGMALIPQLVDSLQIPVIASGGIMDGRGIAASLALGASAVQIGTAFLGCKEAGVPAPWLDSLLKSTDVSTVLTRTFSGKYARGIKNRYIEEMSQLENDIPSYPLQNNLTREIRKSAKEKGDVDFMSLWAGQGSAMLRTYTAQQFMDTIIEETKQALERIGSNI